MMDEYFLHNKWLKDTSCKRWYLGMGIDEKVYIEKLQPCGFLPRLGAWAIDFLLTNIITVLILLAMLFLGLDIYPQTAPAHFLLILEILITIVVLKTAYFVILESYSGQTVGEAVLNIKVVDSKGNPPTIKQALKRKSSQFLSLITFGLGYLWLIFDPHSQALHDKIAKTYVVCA